MGIYTLEPQAYNLKLAEALKEIPEFVAPAWITFVKSSSGKVRPIDDPDFWHHRAASILKQIYLRKIVGVSRLRTKYGSRKNRGVEPERFRRAGGKIIRTILQQSDTAGLTQLAPEIRGVRQRKLGRQLTEKGKQLLESIQ